MYNKALPFILFCLFMPTQAFANPLILNSLGGDFRLAGTVICTDSKFSLAIIEQNKKQQIYRKDAILNGARLIGIFSDHIYLEKDAQKIMLKISKGLNLADDDSDKNGYKKISGAEWIIEPDKMFTSVEQVSKLCLQTKVTSGQTGFKINELPELLKKIGLQKGDILESINGNKFKGMAELVDYLYQTDNGSTLSINIIRDGKPETLHYNVLYDQIPEVVKNGSTPERVTGDLSAYYSCKILKNIKK